MLVQMWPRVGPAIPGMWRENTWARGTFVCMASPEASNLPVDVTHLLSVFK